MKSNLALPLAAAVLLSGSLAFAADVRTDYDHHADFANYHTYSWGQVQTQNPLYVSRVKNEVNKELQSKGWQLVPSGGSATVFAMGNVKNEKQIETMYNGFGGGWGGGWGWGGWGGFGPGGFGEETTTTNNKPVGHLVVDVFDSSNHKLLFRGISNNDIAKNSDKTTHNLDKNIDKMFDHFPPKGSGQS